MKWINCRRYAPGWYRVQAQPSLSGGSHRLPKSSIESKSTGDVDRLFLNHTGEAPLCNMIWKNKKLLYTSVVSIKARNSERTGATFLHKTVHTKFTFAFYLTENTYQGVKSLLLVLNGSEKELMTVSSLTCYRDARRAVYANPNIAASAGRLTKPGLSWALPQTS